MMKCSIKQISIITALIFVVEICCITAYAAFPWQDTLNISLPNDIITNTMPDVFSLDSHISFFTAGEGFENNSSALARYFSDANKVCVTEEESYSGNNSLKLAKAESDAQRLDAIFTCSGEFIKGDYYVLRCKVKPVGVTGNKIQIASEAYASDELISGNYKSTEDIIGNNNWLDTYQILAIPENADKIRLAISFPQDAYGTVYFDDLSLSKIILKPMNLILLNPVYKGLIYGDGGIGDIKSEVRISDYNGYYNLSELGFAATLKNSAGTVFGKSETTDVAGRMNFSFSSDELPVGDYLLCAKLYKKATGEVISEVTKTIRKRAADYRPDFYIDENGRQIKNGNPYFYYGIYDDWHYSSALEKMSNSNIDVLSYYGLDFWQSEDFYDNIEASDKEIHISLMGMVYPTRSGKMAGAKIRRHSDVRYVLSGIVDYYKNNSALWGYYLFDEKDPVIWGDELRWNNAIISDSDINKPTFGVTDQIVYPYGTFVDMADILGVDPYPVNGSENDDMSVVGKYVRKTVSDFPNRPVYAAIQAFKKKARVPSEQEMKNMVWQAVCEGAVGIDWFSYNSMLDNTETDFDEYWDIIDNITGEVKGFENIILSDDVPPACLISGGEWLNYTLKRHQGKTYLFAVNNTKQSQSATVGMGNITSAKDLSDNSNISLTGSSFTLQFDPLEVKMIEIVQPDYLSPEASVENISFYNDSNSYVIKELAENVFEIGIPSDKTSVSYSAETTAGSKLYINNQLVTANGQINLSDINQNRLDISVVSEDGQHTNSYVYNIVRTEDNISAVFIENMNYFAVTGQLPLIYNDKQVFIMLSKNNSGVSQSLSNIIYINQTTVQPDGTFLFEVNSSDIQDSYDLSNYILKLNVAGLSITKNITKCNSDDLLVFDINNDEGILKPVISENRYNINWMPYLLLIAFYDGNGRLLDIQAENRYSGSTPDVEYSAPAGTVTTKMFIWDNFKHITPLTGR